jgi:hypothetical protein
MTRMPPRGARTQRAPVENLNIVPTKATRQLAERMIFDAERESGADSVLANIADLEPGQVCALLGVVLEATRPRAKVGRPIIPIELSPKDRREAHRRHRQGDRDAWVIRGEREYQRANRRSLRARGGAA